MYVWQLMPSLSPTPAPSEAVPGTTEYYINGLDAVCRSPVAPYDTQPIFNGAITGPAGQGALWRGKGYFTTLLRQIDGWTSFTVSSPYAPAARHYYSRRTALLTPDCWHMAR